MKKLLALLLVLTLMLTLTGCKNKAVKNAEELISAIGEVTLDSGEAITAARTAYDALTEKEVAKVENYALLTEAEATLTALEEEQARLEAERAEFEAVCEWLVGDWLNLNAMVDELCNNGAEYDIAVESAYNKGVSFASDSTCTLNSEPANWVYEDKEIYLADTTVSVSEEYGFKMLTIGEKTYTKKENLTEIFSVVDLSEENLLDYFEIIEMPYNYIDNFGTVVEEGKWMWLNSKVFEKGFIYLGASNLYIEITAPNDFFTSKHLCAFGGTGARTFSPGANDSVRIEDCEMRAKGTVCFIKADFAEVEASKEQRTLNVFGEVFENTHWEIDSFVALAEDTNCYLY